MIFTKKFCSALGEITLSERDGALILCHLGTDAIAKLTGEMRDTPVLMRAKEQLEEYLTGERQAFSLPLAPRGTPFQLQVWQALREIPYGETRTYGEIAARIGNPRACRAVGMANHHNPLLIIVPCHRVIGASGQLTGFGAGLAVKEKLLKLEENKRLPAAKLTSSAAK